MFVHIILVRFRLMSGYLFGELLTRLTICSLCIMTVCILIISRFGFECGFWILIAPVPDHCIRLTFINRTVLFDIVNT